MRKPTRRDLLVVIGRLQNLVGNFSLIAQDRNPNRAAQIEAITKIAMNLCIDAAGFDPPTNASGPWAEKDGADSRWKGAR